MPVCSLGIMVATCVPFLPSLTPNTNSQIMFPVYHLMNCQSTGRQFQFKITSLKRNIRVFITSLLGLIDSICNPMRKTWSNSAFEILWWRLIGFIYGFMQEGPLIKCPVVCGLIPWTPVTLTSHSVTWPVRGHTQSMNYTYKKPTLSPSLSMLCLVPSSGKYLFIFHLKYSIMLL